MAAAFLACAAPASARQSGEGQPAAATSASIGERLSAYAGVLRAAAGQAWRHAAAAYLDAAARMEKVDLTIRTSAAKRPDTSGAAERTARGGGVFGSVAIGFRRLPAVGKIEPSYRQMGGTLLSACADGSCPAPAARLIEAVEGLRPAGFARKVRAVNALVNRYVAYRRDIDAYGVLDHWATPLQTLERRTGDCEDYAILKMALLEELGAPASSMSVVILRDESRNLYHAVLALRTGKGHVILDNMRDDVLMDRDLPHYMPLYSVSAGKGFIHGRRANGERMVVSSMPFDTVAPGEGPSSVAAAVRR